MRKLAGILACALGFAGSAGAVDWCYDSEGGGSWAVTHDPSHLTWPWANADGVWTQHLVCEKSNMPSPVDDRGPSHDCEWCRQGWWSWRGGVDDMWEQWSGLDSPSPAVLTKQCGADFYMTADGHTDLMTFGYYRWMTELYETGTIAGGTCSGPVKSIHTTTFEVY